MKLCVIVTLILWCYFAEAKNVEQLDKSSYQNFVNANPNVLIKFFAPWCGHCKQLAPEYEKAADKLAAAGVPARLSEVDCTLHESICTENGVSGYPTLKLFKNGAFLEDYGGPRNADGIIKYMEDHSKPPSVEFNTVSEMEKLLSDYKPTVVVYIKSSDDTFMKVFNDLASDLFIHMTLAHTHTDVFETSSKNYIRMYLPVKLRSKFEEDYVVYDGDLTVMKIREWIRNNGHGLVGYRSSDDKFFFSDSDLLIVYGNSSINTYLSGVKYVRNRMLKAVTNNKNSFTGLKIVYSPSEEFSNELSEYGFGFDVVLPVAVIRSANGKKFKLEKYTVDNLVNFAKDFQGGSLTPYLKSERIITDKNTDVVHVVALNFDEIVNDSTKDVMIVFHAKWCGHCKALMPKYEKAAKLLKGESNVLLAAMDAVENDVPKPYEVSGFPTIYFVPKGKKSNPISYEGGREVDDIIKFVAKEATEELHNFDRSGNKRKQEL